MLKGHLLPTRSLLLFFSFALSVHVSAQTKSVNDFGPHGSTLYRSIAEAAKTPSHCFKLYLQGPLTEKDLKKLPELGYLQALLLEANLLDTLPPAFFAHPGLNYFSSRNNPLKEIPQAMEMNNYLMYFELSGAAIDSFPATGLRMPGLRSITLHNNKKDTFSISQHFKLPPALTDLIIYNSALQSIPPSLFQPHPLKSLNLSKNKLQRLPATIGHLTALEILILDDNQITEIPRSISRLKQVKVLSLRNNFIESLPEDIAWMTSLAKLDLRGNPVSQYQVDILKALLPGCQILFDPPEEN